MCAFPYSKSNVMDGGCWFLYELCWRRKNWYSCSCSTVTVLKWRNNIISILFTFLFCLVFCTLRLEVGQWMLLWWRRKSWCILRSGGSTSAPQGEPWGAREPIGEFTLGCIHLLAAAYLSHSSTPLFVSMVAHVWSITTSRSQLIWYDLIVMEGSWRASFKALWPFSRGRMQRLKYCYNQKGLFSFPAPGVFTYMV